MQHQDSSSSWEEQPALLCFPDPLLIHLSLHTINKSWWGWRNSWISSQHLESHFGAAFHQTSLCQNQTSSGLCLFIGKGWYNQSKSNEFQSSKTELPYFKIYFKCSSKSSSCHEVNHPNSYLPVTDGAAGSPSVIWMLCPTLATELRATKFSIFFVQKDNSVYHQKLQSFYGFSFRKESWRKSCLTTNSLRAAIAQC